MLYHLQAIVVLLTKESKSMFEAYLDMVQTSEICVLLNLQVR